MEGKVQDTIMIMINMMEFGIFVFHDDVFENGDDNNVSTFSSLCTCGGIKLGVLFFLFSFLFLTIFLKKNSFLFGVGDVKLGDLFFFFHFFDDNVSSILYLCLGGVSLGVLFFFSFFAKDVLTFSFLCPRGGGVKLGGLWAI